MSDCSTLERDLLAALWEIPIVDSHSHLWPEAEYLTLGHDALSLVNNYTSGDLDAAGCPPQVVARILNAKEGTLEDRWALFAPYWRKIRNGAYARMWERTVRELLGAPEISLEGLRVASANLQARLRPGWYREVLKDRCKIEISVLDRDFMGDDGRTVQEYDPEFFLPTLRAEQWLSAHTLAQLQALERKYSCSLHALDDLTAAVEVYFARGKAAGAVAFKMATAYTRTLLFEKVTRQDAELCFNGLSAHRGEGLSWLQAQPLQDYLLHFCLRLCREHDLTVIFHTGLQAGGHNLLPNANPLLLSNLFAEYREVRFDLFHAGYPWVREVAVLAKYFPNVWADLAWAHIISAAGVRSFLPDWLDLVPANKILGFGADLADVEPVYGHVSLARENLAAVLAGRVARGYDTFDQALDLARIMLREAPVECFRLSLRPARGASKPAKPKKRA